MSYFKDLQEILKTKDHLDLQRIKNAFNYASKIHIKQKRKSGESFIMHPVRVAIFLAEHGASEDLICAALLHDAIEDGQNKEEIIDNIYEKFGCYVLYLVESVSKDKTLLNQEEGFKKYLLNIRQNLDIDTSVFYLKAADLIHNLSTLQHLKPEKQKEWIYELNHDFFPYFSQHSHRIMNGQKEMYFAILNKMHQIIDNYYKKQIQD